ncbi:glycoside hydrolase family 13 protein [Candidatus Acetothermia bacterium]|jgi:glycosidase|nr:glycoside hydrolase family 13 protein [Candidatus Acetothermia bacterium]MCI2427524.1 glycoside hydrolase family 13 protein [Candidatus Acetothermia bacterium]MCI2427984.1 glycoside hydrolase family 13 protein [Candidatus Acetothermia bacterium]
MRTERLTTPDWIRDAIFYQIFPERFFNGDPGNDPDGVWPWGDRPQSHSFFGGDLVGIVKKLDYLQRLGVNTLYLTPIFTAPSNHKYDTEDYFRVDPAFGGNAALRRLITELHDRQMRIVLDGVFNHCGKTHPFFQDIIARGPSSPYWNWFTLSGEQVVYKPQPNYVCWAGVASMPEWNHRNPDVWEYLLSVVRYWINEYKIDGWRLDTTEYLPPDFVRSVRSAAKEENPDAYVMGEVMGLATSWFKHDALDGVMHYKLWEGLVSFFAKGEWDAGQFSNYLHGIWKSYPKEANYTSYTLLGSHDKPRFLTLCNDDHRKFLLAAAFLFTFPGVPAIYYGDEIGMRGEEDPDCRRTFLWNEEKQDRNIFGVVKELIKLRTEIRALRRGEFVLIQAEEAILAYLRQLGAEKILIVINTGNKPVSVKLPASIKENFYDLYLQENTSSPIEVPAVGFRILRCSG